MAPALTSLAAAWIAARIGGCKLWLHVQDLELDAAVATGIISGPLNRFLPKFAAYIERVALRLPDRVSAISQPMCAKIVQKGVRPERVLELRNWADPAITPDDSRGRRYRDDWGLNGRKVALYSGNLGQKQGLEILIKTAAILQDRSDIAIVICGEGAGRSRFEVMSASLRNVMIKDLQPSGQMKELLGLADVHLLPQVAGAADLVLPSKLVNMLASGLPIVATAAQGTALFAEVEGCGICVPPGDAHAMAEAIVDLLDNSDLARDYGAEARRRAEERWSQCHLLGEFEVALADICRGEGDSVIPHGR